MSYEGEEPKLREEVSLGVRLWHSNPDVILLYSLDRKKFGVKYGQIKAEETSGTDTTVTLESKSGWNYEVTRRGKEDYSTSCGTWMEVQTVSY
ncbi:uncharacterized protein [Pocillopora verrucosa]|uniref:uncharacterized protein n=1 Tax=Pocillopora verrucosa TaxID=203993 RepID=UPI00333EB897